MGAPADEWNEAAARLFDLSPSERVRSADFGRLYELAIAIGRRLLAKLALDDERARDLVADLLVSKLDDLVEATDPYPYFCMAVKNAGKSWLRRPTAKVRADATDERVTPGDAPASARLELDRVLVRLRQEEVEIFAAIAVGEDREVIARRYRTTRANIDQIISRARKRLKDEGLA